MLGHYLSTLSTAQEDAVLTAKMAPERMHTCLVGTADGYDPREVIQQYTRLVVVDSLCVFWFSPRGRMVQWKRYFVGHHYDLLCRRFGTAHVNAALRTRILENRARRALHAVPPKEAPCWATT